VLYVAAKVSEQIGTTVFRVLLYTRACTVMYAHKKSKTSLAPIFTKHAKVQQNCVQTCYPDFHLDQTVTVRSMNIYSLALRNIA